MIATDLESVRGIYSYSRPGDGVGSIYSTLVCGEYLLLHPCAGGSNCETRPRHSSCE